MDGKCLKCGHENPQANGACCPECGAVYAKVLAARTGGAHTIKRKKFASRKKRHQPWPAPSPLEHPFLAKLFYVLALLGFVGGVILCVTSWPQNPGPGYQLRGAAYMLPITYLVAGVVQGAVFSAFGLGLAYLHGIYNVLNEMNPDSYL